MHVKFLTPVLRVKQGKDRIRVSYKGEFGIGGRSNFVQRIHVFPILNKQYIAVARNAGLVQLYEKMLKPFGSDNSGTCTYKLVKEWKNSTTGPRDPIVGIGAFRNQYMYTCSAEGKLVIRDLINDDADDSVKLFVIDGPLSCISIEAVPRSTHIVVAAGGKGNSLKIYDFDFATSDFKSNFEDFANFGGHLTRMGLVSSMPEGHSLLRRSALIRHSFIDVRRLIPVSDSSVSPSLTEGGRCAYWVLSVTFWRQGSTCKVFAGTQFGDLFIYDVSKPYNFELRPERILQLSQFCINQLQVFNCGQYLFYTDAMSKAGVIDIETLEVVNFFDYLRIGPTLSSQLYTCNDTASKVSRLSQLSRFLPIYLVATTIDGAVVIYKLCDSNDQKLCFHSNLTGVIPHFDFLESDPYKRLDALFGDSDSSETQSPRQAETAPSKRRKANDPTDANFIMHASSHQGGGHNELTTPHEQNDGLVNDIRTMKLAN